MKTIHIIAVGKNKERSLLELEADYLKRNKTFKIQIHEVKNFDDKSELEGAEVIAKLKALGLKNPYLITLEERGREYDSPSFAAWLGSKLEVTSELCFVLGGAAGHGENVLSLKKEALSLGKLTYPHKIARMLLVEQLYRAETILEGHPYHK